MTATPAPRPSFRRATPALATLALFALLSLAGCTSATTHTSTLRVDYGGTPATVQVSVDVDASSHPAASLRSAHGASSPAFYTALDQLAQWSRSAHVPIEVTSSSYGLFLSSIDGLPRAASDAYWSLVVNGTESQVGMEEVHVGAGSRITWTLTPLTPPSTTTASSPSPAATSPTSTGTATSATGSSTPSTTSTSGTVLSLTAPAQVETRGTHLQVNGTVTPGALLAVRGGAGSPVVAADGTWTYALDPAFGETHLVFTADDGHGALSVNVTAIRLASAQFDVKYTAAVPPHAASSDTVWYDPDEQASKSMYLANGTTHPAGATVHDLMVTWTRQTGTHIAYSYSASLGFGVSFIDGVGQPLTAEAPPYWCYKLNGASASLGISTQTFAPGDDVTWEFAGCT